MQPYCGRERSEPWRDGKRFTHDRDLLRLQSSHQREKTRQQGRGGDRRQDQHEDDFGESEAVGVAMPGIHLLRVVQGGSGFVAKHRLGAERAAKPECITAARGEPVGR
jgi:hypothetical protein